MVILFMLNPIQRPRHLPISCWRPFEATRDRMYKESRTIPLVTPSFHARLLILSFCSSYSNVFALEMPLWYTGALEAQSRIQAAKEAAF